MPLSAVILAAGKSTRMKSALPKPLHEVCGRPMLAHILDAAFAAGAERAFVVVGYGKEAVMDRFGGDGRIEFVEQTEQLGTGHAARMCVPHIQRFGIAGQDVLILAGDVPLIRGELLQRLVAVHRQQQSDASMATAELENPFGYGRVIRDVAGDFVQIVEQADATLAQAVVREVFPSLYCVKADRLVDLLGRLTNDNAKREFYLTDIFGICRETGGKVLAERCVGLEDVIAPNTRAQLAEADMLMQRRIIGQLLEHGVSIVSPPTTYVEAGARIGPDTMLRPFTFVGSGATIGSGCVVGPFAYVARGSTLADRITLAGNAAVSDLVRPAQFVA